MSTSCSFARGPEDTRHVSVPLVDGSVVSLRPLEVGETDPLEAVFDGLSWASRGDRYLVPVHRLTHAMRQALTAVDGQQHVAWLASVGGRPVGLARAVRTTPLSAEIAFEVVDHMQGRGVGAILLDTVTTVAAAVGVQRLRASVLPSNHRSVRLLVHVGLRLQLIDGLLEGEAPLRLMAPARIDRQAVVRVALGRGPVAAVTGATMPSPVAWTSAH